jgi:hypothetical protein
MGGSQFKLSGGSKDELRRYVNSKVEIRGRVEGGSASGASTGATGATGAGASTGASASASGSGQTLNVESVKQIAPSCGQ